MNLKCDFLVSKFAFKFNLYRYAEAATMCLALAVGSSDAKAGLDTGMHGGGGSSGNIVGMNGGGGGAGGSFDGGYVHGYTANLAEKARRALEDPRLTGEPHVAGLYKFANPVDP